MARITLTPLTDDDQEQFILDNQRAFKYGAMEEFGPRDDHYEEDGEIISRETILRSIRDGAAYRIREDGQNVGGVVLQINEKTQHNHLDLLYPDTGEEDNYEGTDFEGMFRFEKQMIRRYMHAFSILYLPVAATIRYEDNSDPEKEEAVVTEGLENMEIEVIHQDFDVAQ